LTVKPPVQKLPEFYEAFENKVEYVKVEAEHSEFPPVIDFKAYRKQNYETYPIKIVNNL
jgi:hypothetical protein